MKKTILKKVLDRKQAGAEKEVSPGGETLKSLKAATGSPDQRSGAEQEGSTAEKPGEASFGNMGEGFTRISNDELADAAGYGRHGDPKPPT